MRRYNRINNPEKIDRLLIDQELKEGKLVIVQFSGKNYSDKLLAELNEICLNYDENFSVRFYGHYSETFDCKTLLKLPNLKALWLDCLTKVDNLKTLTELLNLKRLSLGIFELKETEIFNSKNFQTLRELIIGETKTKALDLKYLEDFKFLDYLTICGHTKNIDLIGRLNNIEYLGLNSISKVSLNFVNNLKKLKTLKFILGGRENIDEIEGNEIETLEIVRVRAFNSFKNISRFKKLKNLLIEDQIRLKELNFDGKLPHLKDFKLINCKTFNSVHGLNNLSSLKQIRIYKTDITFDEFIKQPLPKGLEILTFYTTRSKIDKIIQNKLLEMGYKNGLER